MPIDHASINVVADAHKATVDFYVAALKPLGYEKLVTFGPDGGVVGLGANKKPDFWVIAQKEPTPNKGIHVAFSAGDRKLVDEFHGAALAAGGKDNGAPGPRPHYSETYYGAFVIDPAGNNAEVVCYAA